MRFRGKDENAVAWIFFFFIRSIVGKIHALGTYSVFFFKFRRATLYGYNCRWRGLESWDFQFFENIMRTCHKFHNFFINMTLSAERQKEIKNNPVAERNSHMSVRACDAMRESPSRTIARANTREGRKALWCQGRDKSTFVLKKNATPREMYNVQKKRKKESNLRGMYLLIIPTDSNREHVKNDHNLVNQ